MASLLERVRKGLRMQGYAGQFDLSNGYETLSEWKKKQIDILHQKQIDRIIYNQDGSFRPGMTK